MKKIGITEETYKINVSKQNVPNWYDDCFGIDSNGKLYLYIFDGCEYFLCIYEKSFAEIINDDSFVELMLVHYLKNYDDIKPMIKWIGEGRKINKYPFLLDDVYYCEYDYENMDIENL